MFRSDIGYIQGMSYFGALLSFHLSPPETFIAMVNLLFKSDILLSLYTFNVQKVIF